MPIFEPIDEYIDFNESEYFNERKYIGSTGGYNYCIEHAKTWQCVNGAIGESCRIAQNIITEYGGLGLKPEYPIFNRLGYGNAKNWWNDTLWEKSVDDVRLGDIVVYGSSWGGGYGHVRVVERIEGNKMYLFGVNEDGKGGVRFNIASNIIKGGGSGAKGLIGYIHNPYITQYIQPTTDYKLKYEEALKDIKKIKDIVEKYE